MEFFIKFINILLLLFLIYIPILIYKKEKKEISTFLKIFLQIFIFSSFLIIIFSWWYDKSNQILLNYYGYNYNALNQLERFSNVLPNNIERVKEIELNSSGIGWTLKAIFMIIFYTSISFILTFFIKFKHK